MGNFFQSIHLRPTEESAAHVALATICQGTKLRLWVSPMRHGWMTVFPNRIDGFGKICGEATRALGCTAVGMVVHDSDVFCCSIFTNGREEDDFASNPDYFRQASAAERRRAAGDPEKVRSILVGADGWERLLRLRAQRLELQPELQMQEMLQLLGIADGLGAYDDLEAGEREAVSDWSRYTHIPDLAAEKEARKKRTAAIKAQKVQLKNCGLLVDEIKCDPFEQEGLRPIAGDPATGGFLVSTVFRRSTKRWLPPAKPAPAPELDANELIRKANGLNLLTESAEIMKTYKSVVPHPTEPYLLCLGVTWLGIANSRNGKLIRQLAAQNPLLIPKKTAQWRAAGTEPSPFFELARDDILCAAFSPDARLVFFGTAEGLRIHRFEDLLTAEQTMPPPIQSHETSVKLQDHLAVRALFVDAASERILYTAYDETIWSYHWPTGTNSPLTPMLGNFCAYDLHVSGNGELLACSLRGPFDEPRQRDKFIVRVWNLRRLIAEADKVFN